MLEPLYNAIVSRPAVITPTVVRKLTEAFKLDVTVEEACRYAGISKDTYYRKLNEDEGFSDEMERSRLYVTMLARRSVITQMEKDGTLALKYLERKRREEFSLQYRQEPEEPHIDFVAHGLSLCDPATRARLEQKPELWEKYQHRPVDSAPVSD